MIKKKMETKNPILTALTASFLPQCSQSMSVAKKIEAYRTLPPVTAKPKRYMPLATKMFIKTTWAAIRPISQVLPKRQANSTKLKVTSTLTKKSNSLDIIDNFNYF